MPTKFGDIGKGPKGEWVKMLCFVNLVNFRHEEPPLDPLVVIGIFSFSAYVSTGVSSRLSTCLHFEYKENKICG